MKKVTSNNGVRPLLNIMMKRLTTTEDGENTIPEPGINIFNPFVINHSEKKN